MSGLILRFARIDRLALLLGVDVVPAVVRGDHRPIMRAHGVRHHETHFLEAIERVEPVEFRLRIRLEQADVIDLIFSGLIGYIG